MSPWKDIFGNKLVDGDLGGDQRGIGGHYLRGGKLAQNFPPLGLLIAGLGRILQKPADKGNPQAAEQVEVVKTLRLG